MKIRSIHCAAKALALCAGAAVFCGAAQAADFTTSDGYAKTCSEVAQAGTPAQLRTDDMRVAFVVCRDTGLVRQIVTWVTQGMKRIDAEKPSQEFVLGEIFKEIDYVRSQLAESRAALEKIHLGSRKSLRLVPAQWAMDLNGDGKIDTWEKYFFAIPKRSKQAFSVGMPNDQQAYYEREYQLDAAIKVDQSDVLWALSYHYFIEGVLANVRAFDLGPQSEIVLARPDLLKQAHQLIGRGIATSEKMRKSVLAETGNDEEWIGNPSQTASVFPIALDAQDFATWGAILAEWDALWQGRRLLPIGGHSGLLGEINLCPDGTGFNIKTAYLQPPPKGTIVAPKLDPQFFRAQCQKADRKHVLSTLPAMIAHARESDPGMQFLRYLYWTN